MKMGPKSQKQAAGKGKKSTVVDGLSTEDMSKDQLEEHIIRLREELEREREERSYFQLERDKMQAFWETSRRELERARDTLRHREREREEAEERHRVEINVYKQKLKHVLSEHHVAASELKMDAVAAAALTHEQHAEAELGLRELLQKRQADAAEKRRHEHNGVKELKLKHKVALLELTNDYDRRLAEMEVKYHRKTQLTVEAEGKRRRSEVSEAEDRANARIVALTDQHERALRGVDEYYSALQTKALADEKVLKEGAAEVQQQLAAANGALSAAQQQNKRLRVSLKQTQLSLCERQRQLREHERDAGDVTKNNARLKLTEKELRDLKVEKELLLQAFEQVQGERDDLLQRHTNTVMDLQQRSGLKDLLLQRKLDALTQTVEKNEAQLCAALSAANATDANATTQTSGCRAAHKLEEILASKRSALGAAQDDLSRRRQEYDRLVLSCTQTLHALNAAPPQHFPSAAQVLNEATPIR